MSELVGHDAIKKLIYYPTTTRDQSNQMGRITDLLKNGKVLDDLGIENIAKETDRAMVCGSIGLNTDLKEIFKSLDLKKGLTQSPLITL